MYDYSKSPIRKLDKLFMSKLNCINTRNNNIFETEINNQKVQIHTNFPKFSPPYQSGTNIFCSQQFMDFLWCACFYFFVAEEESQELLKKNPSAEYLIFDDKELCQHYDRIYNQMVQIISGNDDNIWPNEIASPSYTSVSSSKTNMYIGKVNSLYSYAISYIILHEFGHFYYGHTYLGKLTDEEIIKLEQDADNFALNKIFHGDITPIERLNIIYGCLIASLSCMQIYKPELSKSTGKLAIIDSNHPQLHKRVENILLYNKIYIYGQIINGKQINEEYFYHFISQIFSFYLSLYFKKTLPNYNAGLDCKNFFEQLCNILDQYIRID